MAVTPDRAAGVLRIRAEAATTGPTGVEMEALTAASVAALTIYDMVKGVERGVEIRGVRLLSKSGGRSGEWQRARRRRHRPAAGATASPANAIAGRIGGKRRGPRECDAPANARVRADRERPRRGRGSARTRAARGVAERLAALGFEVERSVVPTSGEAIEQASRGRGRASRPDRHDRRNGPDAARRDAPGDARGHRLRGAGSRRGDARRGPPPDAVGRPQPRRRRCPRADARRQLPGSPKGAIESLEAIVPVLDHALETLAGPFDHGTAGPSEAADPRAVALPDELE